MRERLQSYIRPLDRALRMARGPDGMRAPGSLINPAASVLMGLNYSQSSQAPVRPVRHQIVFTLSNHR